MLIRLARRRKAQPTHAVGVTDQPIGKACRGLWYGSRGRDAVSERTVTRNASGTITSNLRGKAFSVADIITLDRCVLDAPDASTTPGAGDFTAAVRFVLRGTAGYAAVARWFSGGSPAQSCWFLGANGQFVGTTADFSVAVGSASYTASATGLSWVNGREYLLVGTRVGTTIKVVRYDYTAGTWGTASTTNAGITIVNDVSARKVKLGEIDLGSGYNSTLDADFVGIWGRGLTDNEIRQLVRQPQEVASRPRPHLVSVSAGGGAQIIAIGQAVEANTAQALTALKTFAATLSQATETDAAQPVSAALTLTKAIGQASETDAARPATVVATRSLAIAQAAETDLAQAMAPSSGTSVVIGQAQEDDSAQPLTVKTAIAATLGQVVETDAAQAFTALAARVVAIIQAQELDFAHSLTASMPGVLGQAVETDTAQPVTVGASRTAAIGQAQETSASQPVVAIAGIGIGLTLEIDTAIAVGAIRHGIGQAAETNLAQAVTAIDHATAQFTADSRLRVGLTALQAAARRLGSISLTTPTPRIGSTEL